MSRLGLITDVHADAHALEEAFHQLRRLGVEQTYCLGDTVDYGLFPVEVIELLIAREIPTVRGNHDRWAITGSNDWDLPPRCVAWLRSLPPMIRLDVDGRRVVMAHARPGDDLHGLSANTPVEELVQILDEAGAAIMLVGHTHQPMEIRIGERMICNPGALLRSPAAPMDLEHKGTFGVLDAKSMSFEVRLAADGSVIE